jgi:hypothetical protein
MKGFTILSIKTGTIYGLLAVILVVNCLSPTVFATPTKALSEEQETQQPTISNKQDKSKTADEWLKSGNEYFTSGNMSRRFVIAPRRLP